MSLLINRRMGVFHKEVIAFGPDKKGSLIHRVFIQEGPDANTQPFDATENNSESNPGHVT